MSASVRALVTGAVVAARFLPIWLLTGALVACAAIFVPNAIKSTSWAYVLPYMTILAVAALGEMLVIMQAGIDLSTAGVITLGGNLLVGVSGGSDHRLALGIIACVGLGVGVGLVNGFLVGIVRLNPLIVTLAMGQILLGVTVKYAREHTTSQSAPPALSSWATEKPFSVSSGFLVGATYVFWTGAAIAVALALVLRYTATGRRFQAVGANPRAAWMAGLRVQTHVVLAYTMAGMLYGAAAVLLVGLRTSVDPAFGIDYLLAPIAAVVIAGAALSGGLASATSTWMAALALTFLPQMLLIRGWQPPVRYIVYGATIIVGMLVSGDRVASLLGRILRPTGATGASRPRVENTS